MLVTRAALADDRARGFLSHVDVVDRQSRRRARVAANAEDASDSQVQAGDVDCGGGGRRRERFGSGWAKKGELCGDLGGVACR